MYKNTPLREKKKTEKGIFIGMCAARDRKPGFDSEFTGTVLRIKLRGEIDHHSAVAVRSAIDDMIRTKRPAELIIDMSAVDFMDSSGLGLIMGRYNTIREIGGTVKVADPTPSIEKIMKLAGMERIIKIVHTTGRSQETATRESVASAAANSAQPAGKSAVQKDSNMRNVKEVNEK